ncbi:MAG: LamG domain-containing protein [Lentisphaeria bacterium]|nr:LamG domain-containing protein [Lentisphaeria bacterium]
MHFKSIILCVFVLTFTSAAAEHRVPLGKIRTYDNTNNWFREHEDNFPMAGKVADSLAEFSTSLWFRVTKYPITNMKEHRDMASLFSRGWSQELRLTSTGKLMNFYCLTNREAYFAASPHVFLGHWTHVVTTFSVAQQKVVTYVDGIKQGDYKGPLTPVRPQAKGCHLTVGQAPDHWNPFDGDIADMRWFDHALTEAEAKELFANPLPEIAKQLGQEEIFQKLLKIYPVAAPLGDKMILPDQQFDKKASTVKELHIVLAPGEYEPAALALHAPTDHLQGLSVCVAKDLKNTSGNLLPTSAIDLKYVQCWYQGGTAWEGINADNNVAKLVPELLVNDPNLIIIDSFTGSQYVKLGGIDGQTARNIHTQKQTPGSRWDLHFPITDNNDIRDTKTLQPLNLKKGQTRELFVTVHAPKNATPGEYVGRLEFRLGGPLLASIPLKVTILPFKLATPRLAYDLTKPFIPSLYYTNGMNPKASPELNPMNRSTEQIAAELANLKAHGIDNPFNYQLQTAPFDLEFLRKMLRMRKEAGLSNRPAFLSGPESNMGKGYNDSDEAIADLRQKVRNIMAVIKEECGHSDVYFYGVDEASKEKVTAQKKLWDAIHAEGGRVFTSDCSVQCFGADIDGKLLDLLTLCRDSSPKFAAKRHATNGLIFSYGNPQGGVENPLIYRRNYGIRLWKHNYDGFATYCYYESFGHPWDDFDNQHYRDHNLVYPTADGVIDTLAWEGFREAVDDIRYACTLALAIQNNPAHSQAKAAQAFLDAMTGEEPNLDALRHDIIAWILKLRK